MKLLFFLLSLSAFSSVEIYKGISKGKTCVLRLDVFGGYADVGECGVLADQGTKKIGNKLIFEGGTDFVDCKVEVLLDAQQIPYKASLSTRYILKPFYTKEIVCKDLIKIK